MLNYLRRYEAYEAERKARNIIHCFHGLLETLQWMAANENGMDKYMLESMIKSYQQMEADIELLSNDLSNHFFEVDK